MCRILIPVDQGLEDAVNACDGFSEIGILVQNKNQLFLFGALKQIIQKRFHAAKA